MRALLVSLVLATLLGACQEGPAERAGRGLDNLGRSVRDTVDPPRGPSERVGRAIDRAVN